MEYRMFADRIKQSVSCSQVLEANNVEVNRHGFAVCPFHGDTDASLKVYPNGWHCFGCHKGGDVISLASELYGTGFKDTVARLNDEFSVGLDIDRKMTTQEKTMWAFRQAIATQERRKAKEKEVLLEKNFLDALSTLLWLDGVVQDNEPDPDGEWSPAFRGYLQARADAQERVTECEVRRMVSNER